MTNREHAPVPELLERIDALAGWIEHIRYQGPMAPLGPDLEDELARTKRNEDYWRRARARALAEWATEGNAHG